MAGIGGDLVRAGILLIEPQPALEFGREVQVEVGRQCKSVAPEVEPGPDENGQDQRPESPDQRPVELTWLFRHECLGLFRGVFPGINWPCARRKGPGCIAGNALAPGQRARGCPRCWRSPIGIFSAALVGIVSRTHPGIPGRLRLLSLLGWRKGVLLDRGPRLPFIVLITEVRQGRKRDRGSRANAVAPCRALGCLASLGCPGRQVTLRGAWRDHPAGDRPDQLGRRSASTPGAKDKALARSGAGRGSIRRDRQPDSIAIQKHGLRTQPGSRNVQRNPMLRGEHEPGPGEDQPRGKVRPRPGNQHLSLPLHAVPLQRRPFRLRWPIDFRKGRCGWRVRGTPALGSVCSGFKRHDSGPPLLTGACRPSTAFAVMTLPHAGRC